jgi:hypothetical protein
MAIIRVVKSFPDFTVQIVKVFPDLYVYVTKQKFEAKDSDSIWFFGDVFPDKRVKFVTAFADLKIQYVDRKQAAGWRNKKHKLQNRIG